MFVRARWRLTAWYALALAAVLLLLGGATFTALLRTTNREVDRGIAATIAQWRASAPSLDRLSAADAGPEFEGEIGAGLADVFVLVVRADGALVANPRRVGAEEFLEHGVFDGALAGDATWSTISEDGVRLRLRIEPLHEGGQVRGAVLAGRSLAARDREVRAARRSSAALRRRGSWRRSPQAGCSPAARCGRCARRMSANVCSLRTPRTSCARRSP